MFGGFGLGRYLRARERAPNLPTVLVSAEEFKRLYVENGGTPEDAETQLRLSRSLGSAVLIGDKFVRVQ